MNLCYLH
ncbi:Protein of unknown function [Bacillus mycoides]|nr:Protein of unknown function [Bacillus mycoides]